VLVEVFVTWIDGSSVLIPPPGLSRWVAQIILSPTYKIKACFAFSHPDQFLEAHLLAAAPPATSGRAPTIDETLMFKYLSAAAQGQLRERERESYVGNNE
jgi:hypothetical protein